MIFRMAPALLALPMLPFEMCGCVCVGGGGVGQPMTQSGGAENTFSQQLFITFKQVRDPDHALYSFA